MPAPTIMLMVNPRRSQRPIARTNLVCVARATVRHAEIVRSQHRHNLEDGFLEDQLKSKLAYARSAFAQSRITSCHIRRFADRTEGRAVEVNIRQAKIQVIEKIEELRAELQRHAFGELRSLAYREVHDLKVGPNDRVTSGVPEGAVGRTRES